MLGTLQELLTPCKLGGDLNRKSIIHIIADHIINDIIHIIVIDGNFTLHLGKDVFRNTSWTGKWGEKGSVHTPNIE